MYEMDEYTVSLLHFEDGLKDECGNTWTATGNTAVSTEQKAVGNSSLYTPASSFLISTNNNYAFGTGDFTIDFWMYYKSGYSGASSAQIGSSIGIGIQPDLNWFGNNSSSITVVTKSPGFVSNKWAHYALVRQSGTVYWFINGNLKTTVSANSNIISNKFAINARYASGDYAGGAAYYDEFRISNIARWTSDFTPSGTINTPTNLTATAGDSQVTLSWTAVTGVTGYNVKRSTTAGGPYTTIATNVPSISYLDTTVANGTAYYYVVTAVDGNGNESANSNEASATPAAAPVESGHVLLQVTMNNSNEREFKLSIAEIEGFISWFNHYTSADTKSYMLNKTVGKEYLAFDKIISFEVIPLTE